MAHPLKTFPLLWDKEVAETFVRTQLNEEGPDYIVASDVVFGEDRKIWKGLVDTFTTICKTKDCVIIYGHTFRYPEKEKYFFKLMEKHFDIKVINQLLKQHKKNTIYIYIYIYMYVL